MKCSPVVGFSAPRASVKKPWAAAVASVYSVLKNYEIFLPTYPYIIYRLYDFDFYAYNTKSLITINRLTHLSTMIHSKSNLLIILMLRLRKNTVKALL